MPEVRRIVRVFLASPGDLSEERLAARAIVEEINDLYLSKLGYQVELVGWEQTVSGFGRPQALINQDLEKCELFVGMLWRRWGTPPDVNGRFSSGFEEEYTRSFERRKREGSPSLSLFFKEVDTQLLADPGEDLKRVLAFNQSLIADKEVLYQQFAGTRDFEGKFRKCVVRYVQTLSDLETQEQEVQESGIDKSARVVEEANAASADEALKTHLSFLKNLIANASEGEEESVTAVDVARLRLISLVMRKQENDDVALNVHDGMDRDIEMVRLMREFGADYTAIKFQGATAMDVAKQTADTELLDALKSHGKIL